MAVVKLGTTKSANRLINYCEKRSDEREGVNCDLDMVKDQFKLERSLWGKEDGIQAHHVIMSFPPYTDNMTTREVAEAGKQLAEELAPGHSAAIYVHTDKEHLHAHIVINSVNLETGKKLHLRPSDYFKTQELSDRICKERGWHVIQDKQQNPERYTLAERELIAKGKTSWKDELRSWIKEGQNNTQNLQELKTFLKNEYKVEMKIQEKNISYLHPDNQKYVRGKTLGDDFTKEGLNHVYEMGRSSETTRTARHIERADERTSEPTARTNGADRETARRVAETKAVYRSNDIRPTSNLRDTREALQKSRQRLENLKSRASENTNTATSKYRESLKQLDSTNVQQERTNNHVPTGRTERSSSSNVGHSAIKTILDSVHQEIGRIDAVNAKEQKARDWGKKQFKRANEDRGEERERGR